ncbi:hypothetical protein Kosp01_19690 [Kocuria sp. NBRC 114282]|nr:hypothetical protein Kosp01_19690 [Kocuria sp. NBRC 114282]
MINGRSPGPRHGEPDSRKVPVTGTIAPPESVVVYMIRDCASPSCTARAGPRQKGEDSCLSRLAGAWGSCEGAA